jgi:outer membrane immunogenic protein
MRSSIRSLVQVFGRAAFVTVLLAAPVSAADLGPYAAPTPYTVPPSWSGFYAGGQLGGAWSQSDWQFENHNYWNTLGPRLLGTDFDIDASGVAGGGQVGFNYQAGAWVLGIEGSITAADLDGNIQSPLFPTDTFTTEVNWFSTVTGRIGYAQGRWLAYAKGGWAGADIGLHFSESDTKVRAGACSWMNGWTVGGGAEYALGPGLSLGIEYDYAGLDTGRWTLPCVGCGTGVGGGTPIVDGEIAIQSVSARLNYRFGGRP